MWELLIFVTNFWFLKLHFWLCLPCQCLFVFLRQGTQHYCNFNLTNSKEPHQKTKTLTSPIFHQWQPPRTWTPWSPTPRTSSLTTSPRTTRITSCKLLIPSWASTCGCLGSQTLSLKWCRRGIQKLINKYPSLKIHFQKTFFSFDFFHCFCTTLLNPIEPNKSNSFALP